jgi:hypothetical protein
LFRSHAFVERGSGLFFSCGAEYSFLERGSVDVENSKPELFRCDTAVAAGPASIVQHEKHVFTAWRWGPPRFNAFFGKRNRISSVVDAARLADFDADEQCLMCATSGEARFSSVAKGLLQGTHVFRARFCSAIWPELSFLKR